MTMRQLTDKIKWFDINKRCHNKNIKFYCSNQLKKITLFILDIPKCVIMEFVTWDATAYIIFLGCAFKSFTAQNRFDNEFIFWWDKHLGIGELCEKDNDACIDLPFRHFAWIWIFLINLYTNPVGVVPFLVNSNISLNFIAITLLSLYSIVYTIYTILRISHPHPICK